MLISDRHKFIFIHVYKVAGISIKKALQNYAWHPNIIMRLLKKSGIVSLRGKYDFFIHITARELKNYIPSELFQNYFKFAFVRNPWNWQVSLYHFILQDKTHQRHNLIRSMANFEEYLEWRVSNAKAYQKDFVTDENGNLIVDFVGRFENLKEDFNKVCEQLGLNASLPHLNKSKHKDYQEYYNKRTKKLVEEHFKEDIEYFGYTF